MHGQQGRIGTDIAATVSRGPYLTTHFDSSMQEPDHGPQLQTASREKSGGQKTAGGGTFKVVAGIGVVLAIGVAILGASLHTSPNGSKISLVPQNEISAAATTLSAQSATALVDEAKSCKTPMATIHISKLPGAAPGMIRIRSGEYLSPAFSLGETAQSVAIPFPTAYATGIGTITVEGEASKAVVSLYPAVSIEKLSGSSPISIWWTPDKPC